MAKGKLGLSLMAMFLGTFAAQQMGAVTVTTANWGTISGPFTSTGTLANQDTALQASFTLGSAAQLQLFTTSYGGGMNAGGTTQMPGGFMPNLVLYNGMGNYVAGPTFPSPLGNLDPVTGLNGDSYIGTRTLAAGNYILAISDIFVQQPITASNLSDGFENRGSGSTFSDVQGNLRNGTYALNITGVTGGGGGGGNPAPVPEPATFWLMVPALGGAALWARRRKASV